MWLRCLVLWAIVSCSCGTSAAGPSTQGIVDLVKRRLPNHVNDFEFAIVQSTNSSPVTVQPQNDIYTVSTPADGKVRVEGSSLSALAMGLHRYLSDVAHVDIYWFIGSRLHVAPDQLPALTSPLQGSSIVPWRYHFNTVTFSYTAAFWTWEAWEVELDWAALRGVNLPLAWVGFEKILLDTYREIGMTDDEILPFFSGPAFQAWNRFGNIEGVWGGGELPLSWIDGQFELQKKIVNRMVELGMTPVLPAFSGFTPRSLTRVRPQANVTNAPQWSGFPLNYTEVTFLDPLDGTFTELQESVISKQMDAFGNITTIYTLDQFNEINPGSGDPAYLRNVSHHTWQSLKAANPAAVWMMQGWLFYSSAAFWTGERISAYLSGVENNSDMLILDLYSESQPQWQQTKSYYGKPWIWCELHDFGGTMGLYGQVMNVTINPTKALSESSSLVGFGLTMEGQEGNEIIYDLLLDQAWSASPIDVGEYFHNWAASRYSGSASVPDELYLAWDMMSSTVYNNTNLTVPTVTRSIFELQPSTSGLLGNTGHFPAPTVLHYDPAMLVKVWNLFLNSAVKQPLLWENAAFQYDLVDITRQVMGNAFALLYADLISTYTAPNQSPSSLAIKSQKLISLLSDLDLILSTNENFKLSTWILAARAWGDDESSKAFFEYSARNQVTMWGPNGEIMDYASKSWGGLVASYYIPRWTIFVDYLKSTAVANYSDSVVDAQLLQFELKWQKETFNSSLEVEPDGKTGNLSEVIDGVQKSWPSVFRANATA